MDKTTEGEKKLKFNRPQLGPGRSLVDWVRLCSSMQIKSNIQRSITTSELAEHNKSDNAWTCLCGEVYNISEYLEYHPGGKEELMKAAGIDATNLFNQTHRNVFLERKSQSQ
ncbi:hypothetical protein ACOME3_010669 [Neoechinorhynchus agilis]